MTSQLYREALVRTVNSFNEVIEQMNRIEDESLQKQFGIWKKENGIWLLLKTFLFEEDEHNLNYSQNFSHEDRMDDDNLSEYIKSDNGDF